MFQMVALYKDPKGETIFDKYETPSFKSQLQQQQQQHHTDSATGTIDSLKKRIQELENFVAANHHQLEVYIALLNACRLYTVLRCAYQLILYMHACHSYTYIVNCTCMHEWWQHDGNRYITLLLHPYTIRTLEQLWWWISSRTAVHMMTINVLPPVHKTGSHLYQRLNTSYNIQVNWLSTY